MSYYNVGEKQNSFYSCFFFYLCRLASSYKLMNYFVLISIVVTIEMNGVMLLLYDVNFVIRLFLVYQVLLVENFTNFIMMFLGGGGLFDTTNGLGVYPNQLVFADFLFCCVLIDDVFGWWWAVFCR